MKREYLPQWEMLILLESKPFMITKFKKWGGIGSKYESVLCHAAQRMHSVMKNTILAPFKKAGIEKVEL